MAVNVGKKTTDKAGFTDVKTKGTNAINRLNALDYSGLPPAAITALDEIILDLKGVIRYCMALAIQEDINGE